MDMTLYIYILYSHSPIIPPPARSSFAKAANSRSHSNGLFTTTTTTLQQFLFGSELLTCGAMVGRYTNTHTDVLAYMYIKPSLAYIYYGAMALNGGSRRGDDGRRRGDICVCVCVLKGEKEYCRVRHKCIYLEGRNGLREEWRSRDANAKRHYYNIYPLPDERVYTLTNHRRRSRSRRIHDLSKCLTTTTLRSRETSYYVHTHTYTHTFQYILLCIYK